MKEAAAWALGYIAGHNAELAARCERILRLKGGAVLPEGLAPAAR